MKKIDTTKIEGYESMSAEEKIAALESYEVDDASDNTEIEKYTSPMNPTQAESL